MNPQVDTRIPLLFAVLFAVVVAAAEEWWTLGLALAIGFVALTASSVNHQRLLRRWLALNAMMGFFWLLLPLEWVGPSMTDWNWSLHAAILPARITLRANAILFVSTALLEPLGLLGTLDAFRRLHLPEPLVSVLSMSVRYMSLLRQEFQRLRVAMLSRGFRPRASFQGYSTLAMSLGMLLVRSLDRSDRIRRAMMARTFGPLQPMSPRAMSGRDKVVALALATVLIGLTALEVSLRIFI